MGFDTVRPFLCSPPASSAKMAGAMIKMPTDKSQGTRVGVERRERRRGERGREGSQQWIS
eukprot:460344-Rhodomonas_salina.2